MSIPLDTQLVRRAREIISDRESWCQGCLALTADGGVTDVDKVAVQFCAIGSIERAAFEVGFGFTDQRFIATRIATQMLPRVAEYGLNILSDINDDPDDGHAKVLALFDAYLREART